MDLKQDFVTLAIGLSVMLILKICFGVGATRLPRTNDTSVIDYAKNGKGRIRSDFTNELFPNSNAIYIPVNAKDRYRGMQDETLTRFPIFNNGQGNWAIKGNHEHWLVDEE